MTKEFLLSAIGDMDDDLIAEAADIRPPRRGPLWAKYTAAAACLCLCAVAVLSFPAFMRCGSMAPESANKQDAAVMDRDDFFYTAEDEVRDTVDGILMQGVNFLFFDEDGGTRYLWWNYPDGIVSTEEVLSAYLREAGSDIACLSVTPESHTDHSKGHTCVLHLLPIDILLIIGNIDAGDGILPHQLHKAVLQDEILIAVRIGPGCGFFRHRDQGDLGIHRGFRL